MLYRDGRSVEQPTLQLVWIDRSGREERIDVPFTGVFGYPRLSPDGATLALDVHGENRDIWLYDIARRTASQLSMGATEDLLPIWSRDGKRVFWGSNRAGHFDVYSRAADGATPERLEYGTPKSEMPLSLSADGTKLFISEDFRNLSLLSGTPLGSPQPVLNVAGANERPRLPELSPDGKWIAYESTEGGRSEVFIRPFPDVESRRLKVSRDGGVQPLWNPSKNGELFYLTSEGHLIAASVGFNPLSILNERKLFDGPIPSPGGSGRLYDFSSQTDRFVFSRRVLQQASDTHLTMIVDWAAQFGKN